MALKPGGKVGPWTLEEELGHGGSAVVFSATSDQFPEPVALKVLKRTDRKSEAYERFVREVNCLAGLGSYPGVLPVLASELPANDASRARGWLAMPIAKRLDKALNEASPEAVVDAVRGIADTLARLATEHGLSHRDVKPKNLYELHGKALVGDFGLIDMPDVEELTRTGQKLGPANFTAYEMILDPSRADPFPADVYSLGKTLWVLMTGINFPPNGHQPADSPGYNLRDLRPHARAGELDQLIDRATRLAPAERPTMKEMASELTQWLQPEAEPAQVDLQDVRTRIRTALASELTEEEQREQRRDQAIAAARRLQELVRPLDEELEQIHPRAELGIQGDKLTDNLLSSPRGLGMPQAVWNWTRCSRLPSGPEPLRYILRMGRGLELMEDGMLVARTLLDVGPDGVMQTDYSWQSDEHRAPVGTIEAGRMLEETVQELRVHLEEALGVFADRVAAAAS